MQGLFPEGLIALRTNPEGSGWIPRNYVSPDSDDDIGLKKPTPYSIDLVLLLAIPAIDIVFYESQTTKERWGSSDKSQDPERFA